MSTNITNTTNTTNTANTANTANTTNTPREIWFEHDGARLFAVELGQGHPVVFLHGGLADHRAALLRVTRLADTHRLLCPDLRGSGRSTYADSLSWDRLADDIAALLQHLGIQRAVVGGTSMGSAVALRFALRHPHLLRGLILMSPVYPGADRSLPEAARRDRKPLRATLAPPRRGRADGARPDGQARPLLRRSRLGLARVAART